MRYWFGRRDRKARPDAPGSAREKVRQARGGRLRPKGAASPSRDPIRDWETPDQQFIARSGDPSDG